MNLKAGLSRDALEAALDSVGARLGSEPSAQGWATIELPELGQAEAGLEGEALLMAGMKALQVAGVAEIVEPDYLLSHSATPGIKPSLKDGYGGCVILAKMAVCREWIWGHRLHGIRPLDRPR